VVKIQIHKADGWKSYQFFTTHLKISVHSPVKQAQKLEMIILGNFFFEMEYFAMSINSHIR
jgi:hypothetical protein